MKKILTVYLCQLLLLLGVLYTQIVQSFHTLTYPQDTVKHLYASSYFILRTAQNVFLIPSNKKEKERKHYSTLELKKKTKKKLTSSIFDE